MTFRWSGDHARWKVNGKYDCAEETEVGCRPGLPLGIDHSGNLTDVPAGQRQGGTASGGALLQFLIRVTPGFRLGLVADGDQPSHVAEQVQVPVVSDAKPGAGAVPQQLPLADDLAQGR